MNDTIITQPLDTKLLTMRKKDGVIEIRNQNLQRYQFYGKKYVVFQSARFWKIYIKILWANQVERKMGERRGKTVFVIQRNRKNCNIDL